MPDPSLLPVPAELTVYGYDWCEDTTRARDAFDAAGATFVYVDMDGDAVAKATVHLAGYFSTPVIVTVAGRVFVEPSDEELAEWARDGAAHARTGVRIDGTGHRARTLPNLTTTSRSAK